MSCFPTVTAIGSEAIPFAMTRRFHCPVGVSLGIERCVLTRLFPVATAHGGVVRCAQIFDGPVALLQPRDGIIGRHLRVVAIAAGLRQPIELRPGNYVGMSRDQRGWDVGQGRLPTGISPGVGSVHTNVAAAVGEQNFARGHQQKSSLKTRIATVSGIGLDDRLIGRRVVQKKCCRSRILACWRRAGCKQHFAIGQQDSGCIHGKHGVIAAVD